MLPKNNSVTNIANKTRLADKEGWIFISNKGTATDTPASNIIFILLIFSLIFYAWGEPKYIFLMLLTILIVYIFGILIDKFDKENKKILKKISLIICIILILGSLIFFKYSNFLIENVNLAFKAKIKPLNIVMPIGISFYTFQILSYIIDLYNKKIKLQKTKGVKSLLRDWDDTPFFFDQIFYSG